jgi:hypothetical protein
VPLRPADGDLTLAIERPTDVEEGQADHSSALVVVDPVALWRLNARCLRSWLPDVEVEDVTTLVVVVMVECDAADGDLHGRRGGVEMRLLASPAAISGWEWAR